MLELFWRVDIRYLDGLESLCGSQRRENAHLQRQLQGRQSRVTDGGLKQMASRECCGMQDVEQLVIEEYTGLHAGQLWVVPWGFASSALLSSLLKP
ncbi:hypothetical protein SUGI_0762430 [Cryptomeria japonica]|nr:hypothetical protein SUGI_0762430 [Cryptomeria japonica]